MTSEAAPKPAGKSARQFISRAILIFGVFVCLALFLASPAMAQRGSHGGTSHGGGSHGGGGHASASHGGGGHFGGGHAGGFAHASPAPARVSVSARAEGKASGGSTSGAGISLTSATDAPSAGVTNARFVSPSAAEITLPDRGLHTIFIGGTGRMPNPAIESAPRGVEPFAARNYLWQAPPAPAKPAQTQQPPQPQQQQRPVAPPPVPVRPAPMPVAPPMMSPPVIARPMPVPVVMTPPVMTPPIARIPITGAPLPVTPHPAFGAPRAIPIPSPNPNVHPILIPPAPARDRLRALPITPRQQFRVGDTLPLTFGLATQTPLPIPPKFRHIVLEPGIRFGIASQFSTSPVPPLFCNFAFPNCGFGFDGDFDLDDGFFPPSFFFFSFGGPFGFGGPCLFDGFFLNCFGGAWNGPFGWNWGTPWGYNPALTGSLYPIGGYYSPTPMELNQASVNSIGPSTFLPPQPAQLALVPSEAVLQPVAYLVTKDGIEFGVTKYWVEDNRICYVTTYNIQSCISLDQLDLQATVDINYKRGITFTLTPKPEGQGNDQPQPPAAQPQHP